MEIKKLKSKFRKLCRKEKYASFNYSLLGGIMVVLGLIVTLLTRFFTLKGLINPPSHLILYALGCILAVLGLILYLIGEKIFKRDFKKFLSFIKKKEEGDLNE